MHATYEKLTYEFFATYGIYSVYGTSKDIVLFGKDKTSQRNAKLYKYAHAKRYK